MGSGTFGRYKIDAITLKAVGGSGNYDDIAFGRFIIRPSEKSLTLFTESSSHCAVASITYSNIFISLSFFTFSCLRLDQHLVNQGDLSPLVHTFQRSWLWRLASQSQLYHSGCRVLLWLFLRKTTKKAVI